MARSRSASGQAVPLVLAVLAVGLVAVLAAGRLAAGWAASARARTAADAAALACVHGGPVDAGAVTRANGALLLQVRHDAGGCTVHVAVGSARAAARAEWRDRRTGTTRIAHGG